MKANLIFQSPHSSKFWNIEVQGNKHTVTYGRIGTDGVTKTKEFADAAAAIKDATRLIVAKKKKGYLEGNAKALVVRDNYTFAGKPIKPFRNIINPNMAVKVFAGYDSGNTIEQQLEKLSKQFNVSEMDTMVIGEWETACEGGGSVTAVKSLIKYKHVFSALKHLFVGDMNSEECEMSWIVQTDYSKFYKHYPQLESFGLRGSDNLSLGNIQLPKLKHLIIETGGLNASVIHDIAKSDLKNLEHLEIWLGTDDYGCNIKIEDLQPILNSSYPKLKYLGLKNYYLQDELAKHLKGASILKNIEVLDLSMGVLKDEGAEALYNNDDLLKLKQINCRHHFISPAWQKKLKQKFAAQNINLSRVQDPYDDWFYVEVGE